ncbi:MAG: hypothetical protein V3V21_04225 [Thermoplasmata archaeon]
MADYVVEARGLVRRYGDLVAVDRLDFIVEKRSSWISRPSRSP